MSALKRAPGRITVQDDFWEQSWALDLRFHSESNTVWCTLSYIGSLLAVVPSQSARLIGTLFLGSGGQWMRPRPSDPLTREPCLKTGLEGPWIVPSLPGELLKPHA